MMCARRTMVLVLATLLVGALGSVVQSQFSLAAIAAGSIDIAPSVRLALTVEDLIRFGPVMCAVAAAGLIPALLLADRATRRAKGSTRLIALAAFAALGVGCVFMALRLVTPMPHLVAATGRASGLIAMCAAGLAGGWLFWKMTADRTRHRWTYPRVAMLVVLLAIPVVSFSVMRPTGEEAVQKANPDGYRVDTVADDLQRPWSLAVLPDGRVLVTEMAGRLLAVSADGARSAIAMPQLPPVFTSGGVAGLMDVALDPDFSANRHVYLTMSYGNTSANGTRLVRGRLVEDRLTDLRVLFSGTPKSADGNNGGRMAFLPDGTIALTVGDGLVQAEAQNVTNHLGSVVRLHKDGGVPADNPPFAHPDAAPELYSVGHRNAQGIVFDPVTNRLLVSEHGPRGGDELNVVAAGGNHGWPLVTLGIDYSFASVSPLRQHAGFVDPVLGWTPSIAPSGLALYAGTLFEGWKGDLLVPALKERAIRRVMRQDGQIVGQQLLLAERRERIRDVRGAPDGAILVLTDGPSGKLLRLTPTQ